MVSADVISWDGDNLKVKLKQSKFSKTAGLVECEPWSIPLTILSSNGEEQKMIFDKSELEISFRLWMSQNWSDVKAILGTAAPAPDGCPATGFELLRPIRPALAPHLTWIFTLAVHGKA